MAWRRRTSHLSFLELEREERSLQDQKLSVMQATLDAYAANPILNQLLDSQPEQKLVFASEERAIVEEFKIKRRKVQLQLNLLRKEWRERGVNTGFEAEDLAMAASGAEGSKEWYKAHGSHPHEWPQKMKDLARQRAATELATGSSLWRAAGSRAAASSANRDVKLASGNKTKEKDTDNVKLASGNKTMEKEADDEAPEELKGAEEDQPATGCTASTVVAQAGIDSRKFSEGPTYRRYGNIDERAPLKQRFLRTPSKSPPRKKGNRKSVQHAASGAAKAATGGTPLVIGAAPR